MRAIMVDSFPSTRRGRREPCAAIAHHDYVEHWASSLSPADMVMRPRATSWAGDRVACVAGGHLLHDPEEVRAACEVFGTAVDPVLDDLSRSLDPGQSAVELVAVATQELLARRTVWGVEHRPDLVEREAGLLGKQDRRHAGGVPGA